MSIPEQPEPSEPLFGITELCREFGITLRAIRFYEDKGLLQPRRVNGSRVYSQRDRSRLVLILRAKSLGASLAQIRHYLDLYGALELQDTSRLRTAEEELQRAVTSLEHQQADISATLQELRQIHQGVQLRLRNQA
ncbi:MerR family DNA-binding transcriptional regulator [Ideonella sp. B7]|uniref:MerR family transcriptional regulator n=1 Tax=Ideonella benzenivorans TaxID=2831643 RepID=UPI001CEDF75F|nr:MerR family DNA-binding transcriptional regulator [Ideonella benzenivorans]MCA6216366.1 MerR family DNA-binding transcriptional regulator [Ideonella benzenivorans]